MAKILFYGLEFFIFWITNGKDTRMFPVCVCVCACTITPIVPKENDPKNMAHTVKHRPFLRCFLDPWIFFLGGVWEDDFLLLGKSWFDYLFKSLSCIVQVLCVCVHVVVGDNVSPLFCKALNIILSFCNHNCTLDKDLPSLKHFLMQVREYDSFQYCWVGLV